MRRPTKVLFLTADLAGGTGAHLGSLLYRWSPEEVRARILCHGVRDVHLPDHVEYIGRAWRGWPRRFPLAQVRDYRQASRLVAATAPDIVHSYFFWPIMFGRMLKKVGAVRYLVENREDQGFNLSDWDYRMLRMTAAIPDRVVCVSEAVREVVLEREGLTPAQTVTIRNGVAMPTSQPGTRDIEDLRSAYGLAPEDQVVGMVANMNRAVKGVRYFIEAVPRVLAAVPSARFMILGQGSEEVALRARAAELGVANEVIFAGFHKDVDRFYELMDVSVLTSLSEGLSMTILESMSHGLPVVATRVGGNPEAVEDGKTGFLVPPRDVSAFADAVIRVLGDGALAARLGRRGRERVEAELSLEAVADRYLNLYSELVRTTPKRLG